MIGLLRSGCYNSKNNPRQPLHEHKRDGPDEGVEGTLLWPRQLADRDGERL